MENNKTLEDITGQESGIVVYSDSGVIVANWSSQCPSGGIPKLSPFGGIIEWPINDGLTVISEERIDDIRDALPDIIYSESDNTLTSGVMDIIADPNNDIPALYGYNIGDNAVVITNDSGNPTPTNGTIYTVKAGNDTITVIAPDGWA